MLNQATSEEIIINCAPIETRAAVLDNGVIQELYIEREHHRGRVGGIFRGKVVRVLPGMQAAFVDIGFERAAFIHAKDIYHPPERDAEPEQNAESECDVIKGALGDVSECKSPSGHSNAESPLLRENVIPDIRELVTEGQSLVVQVAKDQIGTKGARLTTHLSIPSRYLVLMPLASHVGVSLRIDDDEERLRLKEIIETRRAESTGELPGIIVRTAAEGASAEALRRDFDFLLKLWADIKPKMKTVPPGQAILEDLPLYLRILRDLLRPQVERVRVDSRRIYEKLCAFSRQFLPEFESRVAYYSGDRPLFDLYNAEEEINRALQREVQLKSGGYVVFDQTEAMTTIDVNTGAFVGSRNLEETIFKTNLEAAQAIARQLRLRNLGGIIIIDFIDMMDPEHSRQVIRTFEKSLEKDHVKTKITNLSELGLLEMTRKR
ncbi:MAG: Rne/Rng family ribonuclease, partial [Gammaproteobacteria bacterium]